MVETTGGVRGGTPRVAYGITLAVTGGVSLALGVVLAPSLPVSASVLLGVPGGVGAWLVVRRTLGRVDAWPNPMTWGGRADDRRDGGPSHEQPVSTGEPE